MRRRRGQILLLSVLGIVVILLSISTLLIKTSIMPLNLPQAKFREKATEIYYGSHAAISKALADASNNLNKRAAASNYQNYTSLDELTDEENQGLDLIDEWQRNMMRSNPAAGVSINFSFPIFECEWHNPSTRSGYSSAKSNVSISMRSMGFEGLEDEVDIEFTATILELIESDGRETTFKIRFMKEEGEPIEKMPRNLLTVLSEVYYRDQDFKTFNETETGSVRNLGNGTFLVSYLLNTNNITRNIDLLRENITDIPPGSLISHKAVSTSITSGWHHIAGRKGDGSLTLYINGESKEWEDVSGYGSISNDQTLYIGSGENCYSGPMDEVRFLKASKSDSWIDANQENQKSSGFVSFGDQETLDEGDWQYRKNLTISASYLESSLTDFPLLVKLTTSNFNYSCAKSNGEDIRFNKSGGALDYEIEKWNTEGGSFIWVKVPSVSSSSDTTVEMYYGNPNATDAQNSIGVWSGYGMVHHLEEMTGTAQDSTGNGNDGTYTGDHQGAEGFIDGGCGFYDGESMAISPDSSIDPGSGDFLISLWAYIPDSNNLTLLSKWKEPEGIGYRLLIDESNNLVFKIDDNDDNATKNRLLEIVDEVESLYESGERVSAHDRLLELRAKLNPESDETVIEDDLDTGVILYRIDRILDQLRPHIRVVARDQRGITVSTYGELTSTTEDGYGPAINNPKVEPTQCEYNETVTLEAQADDRWYGNSTIASVEYFISDSEPQGRDGEGINMNPVDGSFDSSLEDVEATFSSNDLSPGGNILWIHAKDSEGNWGSFEMLEVTLVSDDLIHIQSVEVNGYQSGFFLKQYYARATVTVVDGQGNPLEDITVHGVWSGDVSGTDTSVTGADGICRFRSDTIYTLFGGSNYEFTFTADSASKTGYNWDGITVSDTIHYP
ncbi:MAG: DUF2341 domain-containing protein [Candidatus Bathyarchaeia archaeon]